MGGEGVDDFIEVSQENAIEAVDGEPDTVIGNPRLGKVVGSDPFGTVARTDLTLACLGAFGFDLLGHQIKEARLEDPHCLGLVLMLRFFVLAGYDKICRNVDDAHGAIGRVYGLAAMTG